MEPSRSQGQAAGSDRKKCPGGRSCPNLRRATVLDEWITRVASERNGYREAIRDHLTRCDDANLRRVLPKGCE